MIKMLCLWLPKSSRTQAQRRNKYWDDRNTVRGLGFLEATYIEDGDTSWCHVCHIIIYSHVCICLFHFLWQKSSTKTAIYIPLPSRFCVFFWWIATLSRHSDATRIGETLGTYRATSSTLRAKWPRRSSRSTNALVGTLERIGWQQVWQGRFEACNVWIFFFGFLSFKAACIWLWRCIFIVEGNGKTWQTCRDFWDWIWAAMVFGCFESGTSLVHRGINSC